MVAPVGTPATSGVALRNVLNVTVNYTPNAAGNHLVGTLSLAPNAGGVPTPWCTSVVDSSSTTWNAQRNDANTSSGEPGIYYRENIPSGLTSVTFTFSNGATGYYGIAAVSEWSGVAKTASLGNTAASGTAVNTAFTTPSFTPQNPNSLIIIVVDSDESATQAWTAPSGGTPAYTEIVQEPDTSNSHAGQHYYHIRSNDASAQTSTTTYPVATAGYSCAVVEFLPAVSAAPVGKIVTVPPASTRLQIRTKIPRDTTPGPAPTVIPLFPVNPQTQTRKLLGPYAIPALRRFLRPLNSLPQTATQSFTAAVSGGLIFAGGVTDLTIGRVAAPAGGLIFGGTNVPIIGFVAAPSGILLFGGSAPGLIGFVAAPAGGYIFGGAVTDLTIGVIPVASGGYIFDGTNVGIWSGLQAFTATPSGGYIFAGSAAVLQEVLTAPTGGYIFAGGATGIFTPAGFVAPDARKIRHRMHTKMHP